MGIRGLPAANQAGLIGKRLDVLPVTNWACDANTVGRLARIIILSAGYLQPAGVGFLPGGHRAGFTVGFGGGGGGGFAATGAAGRGGEAA